jgi:hypothetical protein
VQNPALLKAELVQLFDRVTDESLAKIADFAPKKLFVCYYFSSLKLARLII